ncbi:hypothetical protein [Nocardia sp. NBC_01388]|uniref:hypothetical protein n=1 Tax=Nocardia sp. NBC_01388 TaxID=2903596 RepID=UPI003247C39C
MNIGTTYGGVAFRDVLHARWAFVFDMVGIDWSYAIVAPSWLAPGVPTFHMPTRHLYFRSEPGYDSRAIRAWKAFADAFDAQCEANADAEDEPEDEPLIDPYLSMADHPDSRLLICLGGIPDPTNFDQYGPVGGEDQWLLLSPNGGQDCPYYWTRCDTCGFVDAEFTGRAARLDCGHGEGDKDYNAASPVLLAAYAMARRTLPAKWGRKKCPSCTLPVAPNELIAPDERTWQHARCAFAAEAARRIADSASAHL